MSHAAQESPPNTEAEKKAAEAAALIAEKADWMKGGTEQGWGE